MLFKILLKSLKTKGILIRQVGNMLVPYDRNKYAEITRTDPDTVTIAMKLLEQIGLIKILDNEKYT
ncbi:MAG: phage replisome organizer N-terminal domain-containing protein [Clostridia bacterium]